VNCDGSSQLPSLTLAAKKLHRHQRVQKIADAALMQAKLCA
jgi:hypothetical protein